jgi:hypothetical protein
VHRKSLGNRREARIHPPGGRISYPPGKAEIDPNTLVEAWWTRFNPKLPIVGIGIAVRDLEATISFVTDLGLTVVGSMSFPAAVGRYGHD